MSKYLQNFTISQDVLIKLVISLVIVFVIWVVKSLIVSFMRKKISDPARLYHLRRIVVHTTAVITIVFICLIWIEGGQSVATFLGLASAGIAIAMHDTIANFTGWLFILWRKPFIVGNRIQVGEITGDVIDIRIFEFSMIEAGNWVDAEQSTGRIVHVPNSKVLREPLANYETGFEYIWHEIPVLITFESNWQKAKKIMSEIAQSKTEHLSKGVEAQIRRAAMKYLIYFSRLTPIVYTTVKESGVLLTMRYIVKPRERRGSEQEVWEAVLEAFGKESDIGLAYPTTRFFKSGESPLK